MKLLRNHSKEVVFLDKESILRLELDHVKNIDCESSIESYDPIANNHIIFLELKRCLLRLLTLWYHLFLLYHSETTYYLKSV